MPNVFEIEVITTRKAMEEILHWDEIDKELFDKLNQHEESFPIREI